MGLIDRLFGPPSEEDFAAHIIEALRRAGENRPIEYDAGARKLIFWHGDQMGELNLANLHATYCQVAKEDRPEWLKQVCIGLVNPMPPPADFEHAKVDLLPALRSRAMVDFVRLEAEIAGKPGDAVPAEIHISDHLSGCLVYDLPNSMRFVRQEDLHDWGITIFEAMEVACRNLQEQPPATCITTDGFYAFRNGDAYDCTRMLDLGLMRSLSVRGELVALPVHRDFLLLAGTEDVPCLTLMVELAEEELDSPRPICWIPHILRGSNWEPWPVPFDHPLADRFRRLELRHVASEYAEQKPFVQRLVERRGLGVFVAEFSVAEGDPQSASVAQSHCVWTKGVRTWLPVADRIAFFDPNTKDYVFVPWNRAVVEFGAMMKPLDYWPPRWAVDDFPGREQLREMAADG
jgi:hypothetical protein